MNRRDFFQRFAVLLGALSITGWGAMASAERKRGGGGAAGGDSGVKMVDPKSAPAKAVNYVEKRADIKDAKLKTDRQGLSFDKQSCKNCGFYLNPKQHNGSEIGGCQIFAGQHVKAEGWCSSWNKKA